MRNEDWMMFLDLCLKTKKASRPHELLNLFLTMEEKEHLASRMQIIRALLDEKLSQREISDKMQVSISQITRGSNALKIVSDDLLKFLENYVRKNKKNEE
jgi:TrpR family trp operon transcriptional repressor